MTSKPQNCDGVLVKPPPGTRCANSTSWKFCRLSPCRFEDGQWWCGVHAPSAVTKRKARKDAHWALERERWTRESAETQQRAEEDARERRYSDGLVSLARAAGVTQADLDAGRVRVTVGPTPAEDPNRAVGFYAKYQNGPTPDVTELVEDPTCVECREHPGEEKCTRCQMRFCPECLESHEREHREEDEERRRDMSIDAGMEAAKEARHRR